MRSMSPLSARSSRRLASSASASLGLVGLLLLLTCAVAPAVLAQVPDELPFEQTEERLRCRHYAPLKQAFFGTTHLHTGMSFDATLRFVPSTPREAYAFARKLPGATVPGVGPGGRIQHQYEIDRALDWGMVTDHSEYFGEVGICAFAEDLGIDVPDAVRYSLDCQLLNGYYWQPTIEGDDNQEGQLGAGMPPALQRSQASAGFGVVAIAPNVAGSRNTHLPMCNSHLADCEKAELKVWHEMQQAAEENYDRTPACTFTSFIAYEAASTPSGVNWHRNVIFRNHHVIDKPITAIDMAAKPNLRPNIDAPRWLVPSAPEKLWDGLREECLDAGTGCDVLTIPHNSNLGGGIKGADGYIIPPLFFDPRGKTTEEQRADAANRHSMEPLVEIFQDKGSSECRWDPRFDDGVGGGGVGTSDELCSFEILDTTTLLGASGVGAGGGGSRLPPSAFDDRAFVRNVLKAGLTYQRDLGINPFKLGIVAASDSHNGTMGWHPEDSTYYGHEGIEDAIPVTTGNNIQNNSGGFSVAWAEENSRDSIFEALKRRETYGTSGTRPVVRFFGGWGDAFDADLCNEPDALVAQGYHRGVPMGGDLDAAASHAEGRIPAFALAAWYDDFIGTPLQRVQVVKGWLDEDGNPQERVYDVLGGPNHASVDEGCNRTGAGHEYLCGVWRDPEFDASMPAFYYARVLENPVCRYSTKFCQDHFDVNPLLGTAQCQAQLSALAPPLQAQAAQCCNNQMSDYFVQPIIQERAWTSPIWWTPPRK